MDQEDNNLQLVGDNAQSRQTLEQLRPKQLRFLLNYLKTGEVARSYQKAYPKANKKTAIVNGSKLLSKYKEVRRLLYESQGLGEKAMIKAIKEALTAEKGMTVTKYYKDGTIKEELDSRQPDHFIRLKAVEVRNKTLETEEGPTNKGGPTLIVNIHKDAKKGVFEIAEEGEIIE